MKKLKFVIFPIIIVGILIAIGFFVFYFVQKNLEKNFTDEITWTTNISVAAINPDRVRNLANLLPNDISQSTDYLRIKEQILALGNLFSIKGIDAIYLLSKNGDKIYFISESTPEGQPLYVAPGKLYEQVPQEVFDVFNSNKVVNTNVYTDEYGTYLSSFSPIVSTGDRKLVGVLGVDIDYTYYQAQLFKTIVIFWTIWTVLCFLIILLLLYFRNIFKMKNLSIASEQKLKAISDAVGDGIVGVDTESRIFSWNNSSKNIFGLAEEKVLGEKFSDVVKIETIVDVETRKEITDFYFSPKSDLVGKVLEFRLLKDKDLEKYFELSTIATEIKGKEYLIGLFHNISKRKHEEKVLQEQKNELEKLNSLMVGRELKMVEMKKELAELKNK